MSLPSKPTTQPSIAVVGSGLSALASAAALDKLGYVCDLLLEDTQTSSPQGPQGPILILNDVAETLLSVLFPDIQLRYFCLALTHRWVHWGNEKPNVVYQPALAIQSNVLLKVLQQSKFLRHVRIIDAQQQQDGHANPDNYEWVLHTRCRSPQFELPETIQPLSSGERMVITSQVSKAVEAGRCCYIESTSQGWSFYAPFDQQNATIQVYVPKQSLEPQRDFMLGLYESQKIGVFIQTFQDVHCFSTAPRLRWPLCDFGWLLVGDLAVKLDPISGEGTPFAIRSAILAAAVIDAVIGNHLPPKAALDYYRTRLSYSFVSHLNGCAQFYQDALGLNSAWQAEINQMSKIAQTISNKISGQVDSLQHYALSDFKLRLRG